MRKAQRVRREKSVRGPAICACVAAALSGLSQPAGAADLFWDGNPPVGTANGISQGGSGVWNTTDLVWDNGVAYVAFTAGETAVFGGVAGPFGVTLGTPISASGVRLTGSGYTITPSPTNTLTLTNFAPSTATVGTPANSALYATGGGTNAVGGTVVLAGSTTAGSISYLTADNGSTLNLTGAITQSNAGNNEIRLYGPGTITYGGGGTFATGKFNVQGGATFTSSGNMSGFTQTYAGVVGTTAAPSTWNIAGGTVAGGGTVLFVGGGSGTSGVLNVSGGTTTFTGGLNVGNSFNNAAGNNGDAIGSVTVGGGTITVGGVRLGNTKGGQATLNLDAGTLNATSVALGASAGGTGTGGFGVVNFNGGTLRATAASTGFVDNTLTAANVRNGGVVIDSNTFDVVVSEPLLHSTLAGDSAVDGGLTKRSTGILTLSGANTYTGNTAIEAGSIYLQGGSSVGTGTVTINSGATLATNTSGALTIANLIAGAGTFSKLSSGTTTLTNANTFTGGVVLPNVVAAIGAIRVANSQALGPDAAAKTINLDSSTGVATGGIELTNNVTVANKLIRFGGRTVAAANAALVNVSGDNAWNGNLEIRGGGGGYPLRSDAGTLTLGGAVANEITGAMVRAFALFGAGDYNVTGLVRNGITATGGATNGITAIAVSGPGKTTLSSANTYTGGTELNGGTLVAANSTAVSGSATGTGSVNINSGGTLAGTGRIAGSVLVSAGGTITAGSGKTASDSAGTLTNSAGTQTWFGSGLTESAGGTYAWKIGATATDRLEINLLNFTASSTEKFTLRPLNAGGTFAFGTTYTLAHTAGGITTSAGAVTANQNLTSLFYLDLTGIGLADNDSRFSVVARSDGGSGFNIQLSAAPEPTTAALAALGGVAVLGRRRRGASGRKSQKNPVF